MQDDDNDDDEEDDDDNDDDDDNYDANDDDDDEEKSLDSDFKNPQINDAISKRLLTKNLMSNIKSNILHLNKKSIESFTKQMQYQVITIKLIIFACSILHLCTCLIFSRHLVKNVHIYKFTLS